MCLHMFGLSHRSLTSLVKFRHDDICRFQCLHWRYAFFWATSKRLKFCRDKHHFVGILLIASTMTLNVSEMFSKLAVLRVMSNVVDWVDVCQRWHRSDQRSRREGAAHNAPICIQLGVEAHVEHYQGKLSSCACFMRVVHGACMMS